MNLINTNIKNGPKIIKSKIYNDKRGFLRETYKGSLFKDKNFYI